jgi:GPH family glycoside/pentoside/hexuronide:cation symporter
MTLTTNTIKQEVMVPWRVRVGWGFGGMADHYIFNLLAILALPVYNIALGMNPVRLGVALAIPRLLGAILSPIVGNISDNTRSRWGRRRPYVFAGAILSACFLPLLWMPPIRTDAAMFWYVLIIGLCHSVFYNVFTVSYTALGYELTSDYDERTRVLAWRIYIGLIAGITAPWLYKLCLLPLFKGNVLVGASCVSAVLGVIVLVSGIMPALTCRETGESQRQEKIKIWSALSYTLSDRPFLILLIVVMFFFGGLSAAGGLGLYINIYQICGGDKNYAATLWAIAGSLTMLAPYLGLPFMARLSERYSKRYAMNTGFFIGIVGIASWWFTFTPKWPYLQMMSAIIAGLGLQGSGLMINSMIADVCDEDELKTSRRREGMYSAVYILAMKITWAAAAVFSGILIKITRYDAVAAEAAGSVSDAVIFRMKFLFVVVQGVALLASAALIFLYPITRERAEETRRILDNRHASARNGVANETN